MSGHNTTFDADGIPAAVPISAAEGQQIAVSVEPLTGKLGQFDRHDFTIKLHSEQSQVGKHVILIHEILHAAEEILCQMNVIKRRSTEVYIQEMAPLLLTMLVRSGLYTALPVEAVDRWQGVEHE